MSSGLAATFRRILLLTLLSAAGGALFKMLSDRHGAAVPAAPEWPPFEPAVVPDREPMPVGDAGHHADSTGHTGAPDGFPVKVKDSSRIFHVPGGRFYDRTIADRHYTTAAAAEADGYRASTY
jgi:hypothetical protein